MSYPAVVLSLPAGQLTDLYLRLRNGYLEWIAIGEKGWLVINVDDGRD